ncbi:unnamed protein product [Polarella glacialis]|uniref:Uncharacterized protein n=1 Tax=Polarella glacialis TaxID=89957 RepID=A0A813FDR6_POLGL|nr:unnamed protein product [Polarella glacialis]
MALEETEAPSAPAPLSDADRGLALLACRSAILRKWSSGFEEIGALVNSTLDAASAADGKSEAGMDYNKAARVLAERQMAACSREVTAADVQAHKAGGLSEAAVERLLGGTALGFQLTEEDQKAYDKAFSEEIVSSEAPSIMGVQVHRVPLWLQILYMVAVIAAISYVVLLVVRQLTQRDKEKAERAEKARKEKEGKKRS